jgi:hypothetical protein
MATPSTIFSGVHFANSGAQVMERKGKEISVLPIGRMVELAHNGPNMSAAFASSWGPICVLHLSRKGSRQWLRQAARSIESTLAKTVSPLYYDTSRIPSHCVASGSQSRKPRIGFVR